MRMYACVHSCAKTAPNATKGRPYRTTTALTTVFESRRRPPRPRGFPTGKKPRLDPRASDALDRADDVLGEQTQTSRAAGAPDVPRLLAVRGVQRILGQGRQRRAVARTADRLASFSPRARVRRTRSPRLPPRPSRAAGPSSAMNWHTPSYTGVESRSVSTTARGRALQAQTAPVRQRRERRALRRTRFSVPSARGCTSCRRARVRAVRRVAPVRGARSTARHVRSTLTNTNTSPAPRTGSAQSTPSTAVEPVARTARGTGVCAAAAWRACVAAPPHPAQTKHDLCHFPNAVRTCDAKGEIGEAPAGQRVPRRCVPP